MSRKTRRRLITNPRTRSAIKRLIPRPMLRFKTLVSYGAFTRSPRQAMAFLARGRELDNFTYEIANRDELAAFVGRHSGCEPQVALQYIGELDHDAELRRALRTRLAARRDRPNDMPYGRRLGWYALTRAVKPSVVVETGVHDGLGSAVLLRALERNAAEGIEGRLLSFDIQETVGWLVPEGLRARWELVIGDALTHMAQAVGDRQLDVFIHDSLHTYAHETAELEQARQVAHRGAFLLSDNAHSSDALMHFCQRHQCTLDLFMEVPMGTFYPGAGIGLTALPTNAT